MSKRRNVGFSAWQVSMFLKKHHIPYRRRNTNFDSVYFEINLDGIKLIRVSNHPQLSADIPWEPDWNVVTRGDYERMKRNIKKINLSLY